GYSASGDVDAFFKRALAKDPFDRFMFAADMRAALAELGIAGQATPTAATSSAATVHRRSDTAVARAPPADAARPPEGIEPRLASGALGAPALRTFALREPPFLGEVANQTFEHLHAAVLEGVRTKISAATIVRGPPGAGKSRIL